MTNSAPFVYDALVVGAGISGLILANRLKAAGKTVALVEKSGGVGGRAATRRIESASFDHGAQFYRVPKGQSWKDPWSDLSTSQEWFQNDQFYFRAAEGGITQLAKHLAKSHEVYLKQTAISIQQNQNYTLETAEGRRFETQALYLSCPLPQSLALLQASKIAYPEKLQSVEYAPALVGLFQLESESKEWTRFKYEQNINSSIFSCSNQLSKKVSRVLSFTVTMDQQWSQDHFDHPDDENLHAISRAFEDFLKERVSSALWSLKGGQLKKWRYSHPKAVLPNRYLKIEARSPLYLLGDAFGGGGIFGAIESGRETPIDP